MFIMSYGFAPLAASSEHCWEGFLCLFKVILSEDVSEQLYVLFLPTFGNVLKHFKKCLE